MLVIQEDLPSLKSRKVNRTDSVMDLLSSVSIGFNTVLKTKVILQFKMYPTMCTFYILLTNPENFSMVIISLKSSQAECIMETKEVK